MEEEDEWQFATTHRDKRPIESSGDDFSYVKHQSVSRDIEQGGRDDLKD